MTSIILNLLSKSSFNSAAMLVTAFLSDDQLAFFAKSHQAENQLFFVQLCQTAHFMRNFYSKTDRSLYFILYDNDSFKQQEQEYIAAVASQKCQLFLSYPALYEQVFESLAQEALEGQKPLNAQVAKLKEMLINPNLPLPILRKEGHGIGCNSSFQIFLSCLNKRPLFTDEDEVEPDFLSLYCMIKSGEYDELVQINKMLAVKYKSTEITHRNYGEFLIPSNHLHNWIVKLLAAVDLWIESCAECIDSINDPFHKLIELLLRASMLKNFLINAEESIGFLFHSYRTLTENINRQNDNFPFEFWRIVLEKWKHAMSKFHKNAQFTYELFLTKARTKKLQESIKDNTDPSSMELYQKVSQREFEMKLSEDIFQGSCGSSMEELFDSYYESFELLSTEFVEYMIDISIDDKSAHWCGHSSQYLSGPYQEYEKSLLQYNSSFYEEVGLFKCSQSQAYLSLAIADLEYLAQVCLKPNVLKKILNELTEKYSLPEGLLSFEQTDNMMRYFNTKFGLDDITAENQKDSLKTKAADDDDVSDIEEREQITFKQLQQSTISILKSSSSTQSSAKNYPQETEEEEEEEFSSQGQSLK